MRTRGHLISKASALSMVNSSKEGLTKGQLFTFSSYEHKGLMLVHTKPMSQASIHVDTCFQEHADSNQRHLHMT